VIGTDGAERIAMMAALETEARKLAGWWGVRNHAAGIFGLPVSIIAVVVVSFATGRRHRA
jgi:Na+(H+)/acetate symporter ActP